MKHAKVKDLRKGDIFMCAKTLRKGERLYVCVRTRRHDEDYFGYILPYPEYTLASQNREIVGIMKKYAIGYDYEKWYNHKGRYMEMAPNNHVTILTEGEINLMNLGQ